MAVEPLVFAPAGWPAFPAQTIVGDVAEWCATWLTLPDGPEAGRPWMFTDQQLLILAYWFAFDDDARWIYRRGTTRLMKGAGKDPLAAVLAVAELCGPTHLSKQGRAMNHPAPWVDIAAVSRDQTRTTMRLFPGLVPKRTIERYGMEVGKGVVYANGGRGTIQAVTSSPHSLEGGRSTLVIRNETQYWFATNEGHEMAEVIDGNLAKSRDGAARAMSFCNAHVPGEDSVGEREWDAWQAINDGRTRINDVFYYAVEAPADTKLDDETSLKAGLLAARGDSVWLDVDRLANEVWDPRTTPSEARRKYLNQVVAAEDAWVAPYEWRALAEPEELAAGERITLGFDGSKSEDHTAFAAARISDGKVFLLNHWDPAAFGDEIPREAVDGAVDAAFAKFDVVGFYADVHPWESYIDEWAKRYGRVHSIRGLCVAATPKNPIGWDMRGRQRESTWAAEHFHEAITSGTLKHDGSPVLTEHVLNARRKPNAHGVTFGKETRESKRRVDALAAAVLARLAWKDYVALPSSKQRRKAGAAFY